MDYTPTALATLNGKHLFLHPPQLDSKLLEGQNHFMHIFEFQKTAQCPVNDRGRLDLTSIIT